MGFGFDFSDQGLYDLDLFLNILAVFLLATIGFAFESAELLFERTNFIDGLSSLPSSAVPRQARIRESG